MKKKVILYTVCLWALIGILNVNAQTEWRYAASSKAANGAVGKSITTDTNGNYYIAGQFEGKTYFDASTFLTSLDKDYFIACYNASGTLQWVQSSAIAGDEFIWDIEVNGNYLVVSGSYNYQFFVAKYNLNGQMQWLKKVSSVHEAVAESISIDDDGNIFVTGSYQETFTIDHITLPRGILNNIIIAKLQPDGKCVWAKGIGGNLYDYGRATCVAGNKLYLSARFASSINIAGSTIQPLDAADIFVAALDTSGVVSWVKQITGNSNEDVNDMCLDQQGNVYLTGWYHTSINFGGYPLSSSGEYDAFVAKYDASGTVQRVNVFGGSRSDEGTGILVNNNNEILLSGYFMSSFLFNGTQFTSDGWEDGFLMMLNNDLSLKWHIKAGGNSISTINDLAIADGGKIAVAGTFYDEVILGSTTLTNNNGRDMFWGIAADTPLSLPKNETSIYQPVLYPNPVKNNTIYLTTKIPTGTMHLSLYNLWGQEIYNDVVPPFTGTKKIQFPPYIKTGNYILNVRAENKKWKFKILFER